MAEIGELIGTGEQKDISDEEMIGLSGYVRSKYQEAEDGRLADEQRWLRAYKNYRGTSEDSEDYGKKTNSKLFIMGINHVELNQDGVIREWVLFDEVAIWKQILMNNN